VIEETDIYLQTYLLKNKPMIAFAIDRLKNQLQRFPSKFLALEESEVSVKPFPNKWSKKEILGHLIDSATNNHHRFIRAINDPIITKITPYDQEMWVKENNYQSIPSKEILEFWITYNKHLLKFFINLPPAKFNHLCDINKPDLVTLVWLINDYVDHLEHHIDQILT
jgi:hypothetical protein